MPSAAATMSSPCSSARHRLTARRAPRSGSGCCGHGSRNGSGLYSRHRRGGAHALVAADNAAARACSIALLCFGERFAEVCEELLVMVVCQQVADTDDEYYRPVNDAEHA